MAARVFAKPAFRGFLLGLPAVALLGVLSFAFIGSKSLWLDEALSVSYANSDLDHLRRAVLEDSNMSLYYIALHFWLKLGSSETAIRSLSALFAVATVFPFFSLCSRLFGRGHAKLASLLLVLNGLLVHYAQEARSYSLTVFLVTLSTLLFVRAMQEGRRVHWLQYLLVSALALYAHFFAGFVILAHALFVLWRRRVEVKPFAIAGLGIGALASPLLVWIATGPSGAKTKWIQTPPVLAVIGVFEDLAGRGGKGLVVVCLLACCLAILSVYARGRRGLPSVSRDRDGLFLAAAWLFVPVVASFLYSRVRQPIFVVRYLIVSVPPLVMIGSLGLVRLKKGVFRTVLVSFFVVLSALSVLGWYGTPTEDWRSATRYVLVSSSPGDAVVFHHPFARAPFEYYARRSGVRRPLTRWTGREERVWLILSHSDAAGGPEPPSIPSSYAPQEERWFTGVRVVLYQREG